MNTKITYYVHGTSTDNEQDIATGQLPGELSKHGIQITEELVGIVEKRHYDAVFSSDLKRAVQTAEILFGGRYPIQLSKLLRECDYGDFTGQNHFFKNSMELFIKKPFPNGESYTDVEKRVAEFLALLEDRYSGKHIAVVAHQAPQLALEVLLRGKSWKQAITEDWRRTKQFKPGWEYVSL